jgi:hypothetical protein
VFTLKTHKKKKEKSLTISLFLKKRSLMDSFISIFAELKGRYCEGAYSFKGAYVYLTIINFVSLSVILTALFTYLDVYHREWLRGKVKAHGMFWCVKGPIMVNFYFGDILLSILTTTGVITGSTSGSIEWPADAVKNGIDVIIICAVMMVDSFLMFRFFGPADNIQSAGKNGQVNKMTAWKAFVDGYLAYIPEFIHATLCCGVDSYRLAKKRRALKKKKKLEALNGNNNVNNGSNNSNPTDHLLLEENNNANAAPAGYKMNELNSNNTTYAPPQQAMSQQHLHGDEYNNSYHNGQQQLLYQPPPPQQQDVYPQQGYANQNQNVYHA